MIGPNGGGGDGDPTGIARIVSAGWKPSWINGIHLKVETDIVLKLFYF